MAKVDVSGFFADLKQKTVSESDTVRKLQIIDIDDLISNEANFYAVNDLDELKNSISLSGLLDPPTVVAAESGKYRIISGHRRTTAIRELVEEGRTDLRRIPCFVRSSQSKAMEELELIMANSTTRILTSPELAKQAERVTALLYELKEAGVEFPGRMRDHVSEACNISKTKLANLHTIQNGLIEEFLNLWNSGKLNDSQALSLAKIDKQWQLRIFEATKSLNRTFPTANAIDRIFENISAGHDYSPYKGTCEASANGACLIGRGHAFLKHDLFDCWEQCKGEKCCLTCRSGSGASSYPCDYMCSFAKSARSEKNKSEKERLEEKRQNKLKENHERASKVAQRLIVAADAIGLSESTIIEYEAYRRIDIKTLRELAEMKDDKAWYDSDFRYSDMNVKGLAEQLNCSADYICGFTDELHPTTSITPKWMSGTPDQNGKFYAKLDCDGCVVCSIISFNYGLWRLSSGESVDATVVGWWPLPDKNA